MAQEDWEVVRFPAIAEDDEAWMLETALGPESFTRQRGEALHPERQPPKPSLSLECRELLGTKAYQLISW